MIALDYSKSLPWRTSCECEMLSHLFLFKHHKLTFQEVVAEMAIYALNGFSGPMAMQTTDHKATNVLHKNS